jgi:hypothetical protein
MRQHFLETKVAAPRSSAHLPAALRMRSFLVSPFPKNPCYRRGRANTSTAFRKTNHVKRLKKSKGSVKPSCDTTVAHGERQQLLFKLLQNRFPVIFGNVWSSLVTSEARDSPTPIRNFKFRWLPVASGALPASISRNRIRHQSRSGPCLHRKRPVVAGQAVSPTVADDRSLVRETLPVASLHLVKLSEYG